MHNYDTASPAPPQVQHIILHAWAVRHDVHSAAQVVMCCCWNGISVHHQSVQYRYTKYISMRYPPDDQKRVIITRSSYRHKLSCVHCPRLFLQTLHGYSSMSRHTNSPPLPILYACHYCCIFPNCLKIYSYCWPSPSRRQTFALIHPVGPILVYTF